MTSPIVPIPAVPEGYSLLAFSRLSYAAEATVIIWSTDPMTMAAFHRILVRDIMHVMEWCNHCAFNQYRPEGEFEYTAQRQFDIDFGSDNHFTIHVALLVPVDFNPWEDDIESRLMEQGITNHVWGPVAQQMAHHHPSTHDDAHARQTRPSRLTRICTGQLFPKRDNLTTRVINWLLPITGLGNIHHYVNVINGTTKENTMSIKSTKPVNVPTWRLALNPANLPGMILDFLGVPSTHVTHVPKQTNLEAFYNDISIDYATRQAVMNSQTSWFSRSWTRLRSGSFFERGGALGRLANWVTSLGTSPQRRIALTKRYSLPVTKSSFERSTPASIVSEKPGRHDTTLGANRQIEQLDSDRL